MSQHQQPPAGPDLMNDLEQRVLGLVEALRAARADARQAQSEADALRAQVAERDSRIAGLSEQLKAGHERSKAVRSRVEALLDRIDEFEPQS